MVPTMLGASHPLTFWAPPVLSGIQLPPALWGQRPQPWTAKRLSDASLPPRRRKRPLPLASAASDASPETTENGKGTVWGSAALVAGTTVGGGFLGLPYFTNSIGFVPSTVALMACWAFLLAQAFVTAELCVATMRKMETPRTSILAMAREASGEAASRLLGGAFAFLMTATLTAQLAKAGALISLGTGLPQAAGCALVAASLSCFVFFANFRTVDTVNAFLTLGMLGAFCAMLTVAAPQVDTSCLWRAEWKIGGIAVATPVLLQLLVFGEIVPTVCARLGGDIKRVRKAVALGSVVPLAMCIAWNAVALGITGACISVSDPLDLLLNSPSLGLLVRALALSAISTTVVGSYIALGQFTDDFLASGPFSKRQKGSAKHISAGLEPEGTRSDVSEGQEERTVNRSSGSSSNSGSKDNGSGSSSGSGAGGGGGGSTSNGDQQPVETAIAAASSQLKLAKEKIEGVASSPTKRVWPSRLLTVAPSLLFAAGDSSMFYKATRFAGAYPVTLLWCLAPPVLLWAARYGGNGRVAWLTGALEPVPALGGGKAVLGALAGLAALVLVVSLAKDVAAIAGALSVVAKLVSGLSGYLWCRASVMAAFRGKDSSIDCLRKIPY